MATKRRRRLLWLSTGAFLLALLVQFYAEALGAFIITDCHSLGMMAVGRCARPMQFALVARVLAFAACYGWFWCFRRRTLRRAGFYPRAPWPGET